MSCLELRTPGFLDCSSLALQMDYNPFLVRLISPIQGVAGTETSHSILLCEWMRNCCEKNPWNTKYIEQEKIKPAAVQNFYMIHFIHSANTCWFVHGLKIVCFGQDNHFLPWIRKEPYFVAQSSCFFQRSFNICMAHAIASRLSWALAGHGWWCEW